MNPDDNPCVTLNASVFRKTLELAYDPTIIDGVQPLRKRTQLEEIVYIRNLALNTIRYALYSASKYPQYSHESQPEHRLLVELITLLKSHRFITDENAQALLLNPDTVPNLPKSKPESTIRYLYGGSEKFTCCWQNHEVEDTMFIPYEDGMVCLDCAVEAELITDEQIQNALCPQTQNSTSP